MFKIKPFIMYFFMLPLLLANTLLFADVSPGDIINKDNYEKVNGMIPPQFSDWLKDGKIEMKIGRLDYDPGEYASWTMKQSMKDNSGKYTLTNGDIVEKSTGKIPAFIEGIPFPDLDPNDPDVGTKLIYNREYIRYGTGYVTAPFHLVWISEKKGFDREASATYYWAPMDGYPSARSLTNPDQVARFDMFVFHEPYDISGTAQMAWRFVSGQQRDVLFAYVPSIRRVRRLTPANRSDAILGSDITYDDAWGYDGKVTDFNWRILDTKEALLPYFNQKPYILVKNEGASGGWNTPRDVANITYAYEDPNAKCAAWSQTNIFWVKRKVFILEAVSKDPYYNYSKQEIWVDPEAPLSLLKIMYDRSGTYWKSNLNTCLALETPDRNYRLINLASQQVVDDRKKRSTVIVDICPKNSFTFFGNYETDKFSLSGFAKFCK